MLKGRDIVAEITHATGQLELPIQKDPRQFSEDRKRLRLVAVVDRWIAPEYDRLLK